MTSLSAKMRECFKVLSNISAAKMDWVHTRVEDDMNFDDNDFIWGCNDIIKVFLVKSEN